MKQFSLVFPIVLIALFLGSINQGFSQCTNCSANTVTVNLSSKADTAWVQTGIARSGTCCAGSNCVKFVVYLNPGTDLLNFNVTNPAPSGSAFYEVNCGAPVSIGQPACISGGQGTICITYCKPGGDSPNYHIIASRTVKASNDISLRVGCAGTMTIGGLSASTVSWTSVSPGIAGQYNSYLSCSAACVTTTVTPTALTPTLIGYRVSGSPLSGCPGTNADTIYVSVVPGLSVAVTPTAPVVCSGGTSTTAVTASVSGGMSPYTYTWSSGSSTAVAGLAAGDHTVLVKDNTIGCAAIMSTVHVAAIATPTAPLAQGNSPLCAGSSLNLSASSNGASYFWTGPNSFTSSLQNPVIANSTTSSAGSYSVVSSYSGCQSPVSVYNATIHPIPVTPTVSNNSPVCAGQNLVLNAGTLSGATYNWTGPNGFVSSLQNPTITAASALASGSYSLVVTKDGCSGSQTVTNVTVNTTPSAPTVAANNPLCAGQNLSLTATSAATIFSWTGPGGFSSASANPVINNAPLSAAGNYSVTAAFGSCVSNPAIITITVNPVPANPTPSSNSPVCAGQSINLSALPNGLVYQWSGPNAFSSTLQNPVIGASSSANAGNYSLTVTSLGCTSLPATIAVVVNPIPVSPVAGSNAPLCEGGALTLSASATSGATYLWSGPNSFISNLQNPGINNVSLAAGGNYSVSITVAGCTSPAGTVSVTVNPIPTAPTASSNNTLCAGQTINLAAGPSGASYNWTGPNGFTSIQQNPTIANAQINASGNYSVTRTLLGCTSPAGITGVTVHPIPAAPTLSSNSPVCSGQTINLSALPSGVIYNWSGPNGFTSTAQNPAITSATTLNGGVYSLNVVALGCAGPASTISVVVNPTPAAPVAGGTSTLCAGGTINLTAGNGASTYNWTGPNGFSSTVQNPVVTNAGTLATGMYSVTGTLAGCTSPAGTFSVSVFGIPAPPTLGANTPLCTGNTLSLTSAPVAGAAYAWTGPNGFTSSLQNPVLTNAQALNAGTYSLGVTVSGCGSSASTINVVVNATPATPVMNSNSPICAGQTLSLTTSSSAASYSWTGPNGFGSAAQNPVVTNAGTVAAGNYSLVTTVNGCPSAAGVVSVTVNPIPVAPTPGSNGTICAGQNVSLTASPNGAIYSWQGPNGFVSGLQNPVITNAGTAASGVYSVNQTVLGCTSPNATVAMVVNPIPAAPSLSSNGPVCTGQTLSLSALPNGVLYNWSGPNSFTSASQNPAITSVTLANAGTYSLTIVSLGCVSPASTIAVAVNQTPTAPVAGGTSTLCAGSTINLTASNGATTYSWSGPNNFSSTLQNASITNAGALATGMYSVTGTVAGCTSLPGTFSVTVFAVPSAPTVTANTPLCTGQTLSLTPAAVVGAVYQWSGPNSFTSNLQNPTISNVQSVNAGTYSVGISVAGCGSGVGTVAVIVNATPPTPAVTSNTSVCAGQILNLVTNASGSYNWVGPNSFTSTVQNPVITGIGTVATGVYSLAVTVNGCPSAYGLLSLTVHPIPSPPVAGSNGSICAGQTVSLTAGPNGASYNWQGPAAFNSTSQNPTIPNASTAASGIYTVNQTVFGCTSSNATVAVAVNPIPASPVLNSNSPICALKTLSLTAASGANSYSWSGPNGFSSTSQNPLLTNASVLASGTYSASQVIAGCASPFSTISVTVNPAAPTPTAVSNSPICLNQTLTFNQAAISGATYSWTGPNSFTSSLQGPAIPNAGTLATGNYSVFTTVAGCPGPTVVIAALVSVPATLTPGPAQTVCANNAAVNFTAISSTGSGTWVTGGDGSFPGNAINGTYTPGPGDISAGLVNFTLTSTNNGGCVAVTSTWSAIITPAPTSSAGVSQTVCANNSTVSLSGSVTIASGGIWSSSGTGSFVPNASALTASYVPSPADLGGGVFNLILTTTGNGNCLPVSNTKLVTISPAPVVIPGPNPQVVCKNNPNFQLNGSSTTGSGTWLASGSGSFSSVNVLNPTYFPSTADTTNGMVTLTLTSTNNGGCNAVSQTMTLVYVSTLAVNAGSNQVVCSNSPVQLNGISTTSAGIWTSSGSGVFSPAAGSLVTSYIPSTADISAGAVTLTLTTANNGGCNPIFSTMNVTITPGPTAFAGNNQTVCANNASVALTGSFTVAGGVAWSSSGTGSFSPVNTGTAVTYFATSADTTAGQVIITLSTTSNGSCQASTSTVQVDFSPAPLVNAGTDISVCKNNPIAILNGYSSTGSASWTPLGTGTLSPNGSVMSPTYSPSSADTTAGSVQFILSSINNGNCNMVSDTIRINYSSIPAIFAGTDQTVCANNATVAFTGTSSTGSGNWTGGQGTFSVNSINGLYTAAATDISSGSVTFTVTSTNNGGCVPVSDDMTVYFSPAPSIDGGLDLQVCSNTPSIALDATVFVAGGVKWSTSGGGSFSPNDSSTTIVYLPVGSDTTGGGIKFYLVSTGNGNCLSVNDSLAVSFILSPQVNAGSDLNVCPNSSITLNGNSTTTNFSWTSSGGGSFVPDQFVLNPVYVPSAGELSNNNATLVFHSGTTTCGSDADTVTVSFRPQPVASFIFNNQCQGTANTFSNTSIYPTGGLSQNHLWYFGTDTSSIMQPEYTFTASGSHTVKLIVNNGVCTDSVKRTVAVHPMPVSKFTYNIQDPDKVQFVSSASVTGGSIKSWDWEFGDQQTSNVRNPLHTYQDSGFYVVRLMVTTDSNCTAESFDTLYIISDDIPVVIGEPAVPTAFTPNGDGSNDLLTVKGGPFKTLDFRIFNEWGNQIFGSQIQADGWDGTYKQVPQPVGKFIWTVAGELINGKKINMAGEVLLHR